MKKTLLVLLALIFITGCADDQYAIERRYWFLKKQAEKIFNNPEASPPRELETIVANHYSFIKKYPNNVLSLRANFDIASLYAVKKEFEKARAHLNSMRAQYSANLSINADITTAIGSTYEIEEKWPQALEQYNKVIKEYPLTPTGFSIPVYIAKYYERTYQPDRAIATYHQAIGHYKGLIDKHPGTPVALNAGLMIADCYGSLADWSNAAKTLEGILKDYKDKVNLDALMMNTALLYLGQLKDEFRAKELLHTLVNDYPKSRYSGTAKAILKKLSKPQE
ncbi:MAG: tetratricopeptide repeat protein [Candidatus Omnitrophica bacterium]|nr:tetratricopeptide repeat protein [Candidatus Omnitrophota bacterium]